MVQIADTVLDFRSDTLTKPSASMLEAMNRAKLGDDVFGEDPTVTELEQRVADLFFRQAALLVPSGTMANLIGLALHCQRGDEVVLERRTHSFAHEVGGGAALFGILFQPIDVPDGIIKADLIEPVIRPFDVHQPKTRLVVIENTVNLAGGRVVSIDTLDQIRILTKRNNLSLHLDGARIFNASMASGVPLAEYASKVDSLSCCLSKGLGCPIGSLVVGDQDVIQQARWLRKMLGGGMRQAGIIAACGLYAIKHNIDRLSQDHAVAQELATGLTKVLDERFVVQPPESNMIVVHTPDSSTTDQTIQNWSNLGIRSLSVSQTAIRLVTHMDLPGNAAKEFIRRIDQKGSRNP